MQGQSLFVSKDQQVSGFRKIEGAHIATNGQLYLFDMVFAGGDSDIDAVTEVESSKLFTSFG